MNLERRRPTYIRLLLVDGTPEGIKKVDKSNWTGQAIIASRAQTVEAFKREELSRTGVYVLTGLSESGAPRLYIGEAESLRERLRHHASSKDFWTQFVAFTSTDESLNKAHVRYIEARLIHLAKSANQWEVDNSTRPTESPLSEADRAYADWFLEEMLIIYPILGIDAFEAASKVVVEPAFDEDLILSERGAKGKGRETPDGFVVFARSRARAAEIPSIHDYTSDLRKQLLDRGVLKLEGKHLVFKQDYRFTSPSSAAGVLVGGPANGRNAWKDSTGRTLKKIQNDRMETVS